MYARQGSMMETGWVERQNNPSKTHIGGKQNE